MMETSSEAERGKQSLQTDVLLVTVTEIEGRAVLTRARHTTKQAPKRIPIGDKTYFDLGTIEGARVAMVQSEMGTEGPGGALIVVDEAIRELSPTAVIMVGIAFGFKKGEQQIGDVLVSQQLLGYELQKVNKSDEDQMEVIPRGDRPQASTRLLDRFRSALYDWTGQKIEFGLLLSGAKLVNYQPFRDQLQKFAPEAIGGEMEGTGLYSAAYRRKVDWILVKAICDWADGDKNNKEKDKYQQQAADNAARFTMHVLQAGGFMEMGTRAIPFSQQAPLVKHPLGTTLYTYDGHASYVVAVDWEPRGSRIASAGGDGTVQVWDADSSHLIRTYRGHPWRFSTVNWPPTIYTTVWSPEGLRLASAGEGPAVFVWNATTGQTLALYQSHTGIMADVYAVAWSPDGKYIASACSSAGTDKTIHIWHVPTGQLIKRLEAGYWSLNFSLFSLGWSPDGSQIAAACGDKVIRIWNALTGKLLSTRQTHSGQVSHLAWSPDSSRLASTHTNKVAQVWSPLSENNLLIYHGHTASVRYISWSPDGARIATSSNDKTVQIWDPTTGDCYYTYHGHTHWATSVAWSPDGTRIASGSNDKTVQIWQAK